MCCLGCDSQLWLLLFLSQHFTTVADVSWVRTPCVALHPWAEWYWVRASHEVTASGSCIILSPLINVIYACSRKSNRRDSLIKYSRSLTTSKLPTALSKGNPISVSRVFWQLDMDLNNLFLGLIFDVQTLYQFNFLIWLKRILLNSVFHTLFLFSQFLTVIWQFLVLLILTFETANEICSPWFHSIYLFPFV